MELTDLELQIVNQLEQFGSLNNKEIAESLDKDTGYISKKMKQLVNKQVVKKKRISKGKITCNYYSLVSDDIDKTQLARGVESTCKKEVSISSGDEYDPDHINLRESFIPTPDVHLSGTPEYSTHQVVSFKETLRFLEIHDLLTDVLEYLDNIAESRDLTSKEARLFRILSEESPNYRWILDSITLFLDIAKKAETKED